MEMTTVEKGIEFLRKKQAERVMPLVGAMLDCWENTPNDTLASLEQDVPHLCSLIHAIQDAVCGD